MRTTSFRMQPLKDDANEKQQLFNSQRRAPRHRKNNETGRRGVLGRVALETPVLQYCRWLPSQLTRLRAVVASTPSRFTMEWSPVQYPRFIMIPLIFRIGSYEELRALKKHKGSKLSEHDETGEFRRTVSVSVNLEMMLQFPEELHAQPAEVDKLNH